MRADVFTDAERQYMHQFKPSGFLRTWHALYTTKCRSGPWIISRRHMLFGALERGNRRPDWDWTEFDEGRILGWHITIPLGFGTLAVWGYRRFAQTRTDRVASGRGPDDEERRSA